MKRFLLTYADGRVETIEADSCRANDWSVSFSRELERQSKSWNAKPGDMVVTHHTFRVIAGRLIAEVREVA